MEKLLLSTAEVAELLGVGRNRVYELIYSGQLASAKLGRTRRIPVSAVQAYVASLCDMAAS
jgi:excisionase family DNA binding protein